MVVQRSPGRWWVQSHNPETPEILYQIKIAMINGVPLFTCNCADNIYRIATKPNCKHINQIRELVAK